MGVTNFKRSVNTAASAINKNAECHVIIKRLNTGRYKYEARFKYEPGRGINIYVIKDSTSGQFKGIIGIDRISVYELEYDCKVGYIPESLIGEILKFYKELATRVNWR